MPTSHLDDDQLATAIRSAIAFEDFALLEMRQAVPALERTALQDIILDDEQRRAVRSHQSALGHRRGLQLELRNRYAASAR